VAAACPCEKSLRFASQGLQFCSGVFETSPPMRRTGPREGLFSPGRQTVSEAVPYPCLIPVAWGAHSCARFSTSIRKRSAGGSTF
jgi:hypothetical protein